MATQGRKNVHGKGGVRFKAAYTSSKYKAMLRNVVSELIVHERLILIQHFLTLLYICLKYRQL